MIITLGQHHENSTNNLVTFDTDTKEFNTYFKFTLDMFDERKSYFTWFKFDPFTGLKINKNYFKKFI